MAEWASFSAQAQVAAWARGGGAMRPASGPAHFASNQRMSLGRAPLLGKAAHY
jgi:hypothetical protein